MQLVDLIDENDDELLEKEQEILHKHDYHVADMNVRFNRLYSNTTSTASGDRQKLSSRKLAHLERSIISVRDAIIALPTDHEDISLLEQYQAQLSDYKMEMAVIHTELLSVDDEDEVSDQLVLYSKLEGILFECSHCARKLLRAQHHLESATTISTDHGSGVKLPKLDVPTFDGSILQWRRQFCVSVHSRSNLMDRPLGRVVYPEAVKSLTARFDRPRLIHQTHVKMILDAPQLRDGSGKELRHLHDVIQQHLGALKSMDQEPSPSSIIELKLDTTTMFEWQRHTQSSTSLLRHFGIHRPPSSGLRDLYTFKEATETRSSRQEDIYFSFSANVDSSSNQCLLCKTEKHPLYSCPKFKSLPHDKRISAVKVNNVCINGLTKGHFVADCKSLHRCQNPHHTLLHIDSHHQQRNDQTPLSTGITSNEVLPTQQ